MRILCKMLPAKLMLARLNHGELPTKVMSNRPRYNRGKALDALARNVLAGPTP
jgi:hypothetical protein